MLQPITLPTSLVKLCHTPRFHGRPQSTLVSRRTASSVVTNLPKSAPGSAAAPRPNRCVDNFLSGDASSFMDELLHSWKTRPESIHPSWQTYFRSLEGGKGSVDALADALAHSWNQTLNVVDYSDDQKSPGAVKEAAKVLNMVKNFQIRGHLMAKIDPLGLPPVLPFMTHKRYRELQRLGSDFSLESFGFTPEDKERRVLLKIPTRTGFLGEWKLSEEERLSKYAGKFVANLSDNSEGQSPYTIGRLYERLVETYCGPIGVEYRHISTPEECNFIRNHFETPRKFWYSTDMKKKILQRTVEAVLFENFAGQKFATTKRFGLDGCESLIVGMKALTKLAALLGVESIVIGMAHRGRLNTLHNVMNKPAYQVFSEFHGNTTFGGYDWGNLGDVKYHMGVEYEHVDPDTNKHILMSILPNPSHLEAVNPVVLGSAKARQLFKGDTERSKVLPLLIHGDASIAGQGIMYETLQMSDVPAYNVGGTIHIVVNNQLGFTTNASDSGSGMYCTDLAKAVGAPIFHVNADDPEAVTFVIEVATKFRQKFKTDVFIDLVGYRRFGHNELDMPRFTQPKMYELISSHPNVLKIYSDRLVKEGVLRDDEVNQLQRNVWAEYEEAYKKGKTYVPNKVIRPFSPQWNDMATSDQICAPRVTGVPEETLRQLGKAISTIPSHVVPHPTIAKVYKARYDACDGKGNVDYGFAEALAFGSLLRDGYHIRLAGQDSQRGTFSHRHAAIHDQKSGRKYFPLTDYAKSRHYKHGFECYNTTLSEYACSGFEYGWSLENPHALNIWEAQFGDFANGAQIVIDQFITSGEIKWGHPSGLVLMLPHGFDGQGPEHSSCRIERFLCLCDDREDVIHPEHWDVALRSVIQKHNIQVVNCSIASNFFHVLRRQMHRGFRKPLILITPKRLLRLRDSASPLSEFIGSTRFQRHIQDPTVSSGLVSPDKIKRLILCSGQVYYDLVKYRHQVGKDDSIAISRIEQLSPFPLDRVTDEIQMYPNLQSLVWCQEEPMNQGAWTYAGKRITAVLQHLKFPNDIRQVIYAGRNVCGISAVGDIKLHSHELNTLMKDAMDLERRTNSYYEQYV